MLANPTSNSMNLVEHLVTISKPIEGMNAAEKKEYELKCRTMTDLVTNNYSIEKYDVEQPNNNATIRYLFKVVSNLPPLLNVTQTKPTIPVFDTIEVLPTDSVEIQKFIRKVNFTFVGYYCNHITIDEKCDKVFKNITELLDSKHYEIFKDFMDTCCSIIERIFHAYETDKFYNYKSIKDFHEIPFSIFEAKKLLQVKNAILHLNAEITVINSKTNKKCSKCEAIQRKYNYCLFEIDRMRKLKAEQDRLDEMIGEEQYDILEFMSKHFPTIERLPLKDVQDKFYAVHKIKYTIAQFSEKLTATNKFFVTNVHRTFYVNRK